MFIVIEGIDGAGCETQGKNLLKLLKEKDHSVSLIKYPNYEKNIGKIIRDFLYKNKSLTANQQFLLYTTQFILDKQFIQEKRKNQILIADRYFTTTLCYQTLEGFNEKFALEYAKYFEIEKPDLIFYLDVSPETAIKRKYEENKEKNRREKDFQFIRKTYQKYQDLIKRQVWTKWIKINGEQEIEKITNEIAKFIL